MCHCHAQRIRKQASRHVTPNLLYDWVISAWFEACENSCFSSLPAAGSDEGGETPVSQATCFGPRIKAFPEVEKLWTGKDATSDKIKKKEEEKIANCSSCRS